MGGGGGGVRQQASAATQSPTSPTPRRPSGRTCKQMISHNSRMRPTSTCTKNNPPADPTAQVFRLGAGAGRGGSLLPPPRGSQGTARGHIGAHPVIRLGHGADAGAHRGNARHLPTVHPPPRMVALGALAGGGGGGRRAHARPWGGFSQHHCKRRACSRGRRCRGRQGIGWSI
jgi:hypothetical protein